MKMLSKSLIAGALFVFFTGCAVTNKLPSVTVGGGANKDAVLDAHLNKDGVGLTLPLVDVSVPFPDVTVEDGKKK
mgnify:CR=1 FL=1|jgi:hypothetical protein|tara:strand:+ start:2553 stop:2777 length:225 start_codon:yes stop_codon:yes gene_type:complete